MGDQRNPYLVGGPIPYIYYPKEPYIFGGPILLYSCIYYLELPVKGNMKLPFFGHYEPSKL